MRVRQFRIELRLLKLGKAAQLFCIVGFVTILLGCQRKDSESPLVDSTSPEPSARLAAATATSPALSHPGSTEAAPSADEVMQDFVPDWVADAVFYQIFPERFRNGDPKNDPTRESLETPIGVGTDWKITPWTADWYARADWEKELGDNFYDHGVFNRRYGGDLQGVLDKLDYLAELGVNTLYFNPVFYARSMHKYDGTSMHHIDPYFGPDPQGDLKIIEQETSDPATWQWTAADRLFLKLIQETHQRDMRLIIDGVFNHTGRDFFAFDDIRKKQEQSDYVDWYIIQNFDDPTTPNNEFRYKSWWGFETLPEFSNNAKGDDLHPSPKKYMMDITRRWMDPDGDGNPADGIDGWRLDVANEVPMRFWHDWNNLVRELNPDAYTVGEFWDNARDQLIEGRFSGTMNYHNFAFLVKGYLIDGKLTPHDFGRQLESRRKEYPGVMQFALQNLVDSHDTDRVASMIVNAGRSSYKQADRFDYDVSDRVNPRYSDSYDVRRPNQRERQIQRLVALMQMTYVGAPMVYYGTEAGMWGADDPCDRMPMTWDDLTFDDQTNDPKGRSREADPVAFDQQLFEFYQRVIKLRNDSAALRRGTVQLLDHDDDAQFFSFQRELDGETIVVAMNRGEADFTWKFTLSTPVQLEQLLHTLDEQQPIAIKKDGKSVELTIPALSGVVFSKTSDDSSTGE